MEATNRIGKMTTRITFDKIGFLLHVVVEIPAAVNFMVLPSKQLGSYTPNAHAVIRQYALLLLCSVSIAMIFLARPTDNLSRSVAGSLAIYHIGPILRSCGRLRTQASRSAQILRSEAFQYLICHILCGTSLSLCYLHINLWETG